MKSVLLLLSLSSSAGAGVLNLAGAVSGGGALDLAGAFFGNSNKQFRIGFLLDREGEREEAVHWYQKSADQKNAEAANRLGLLYEEEDRVKAVLWHKRAIEWGAENGLNTFSAFSLKKRNTSCFYFGAPIIGIPSPQAASALRLGYLYQKGDDDVISHDPDKAQHFYQKAYFLGVSPLVIGEMYELLHEDLESAVEWYEKEQTDKIQAFYKTGRALMSAGDLNLSAEFYKKSIEQHDKTTRGLERVNNMKLNFEGYDEVLDLRNPARANALLSRAEYWFNFTKEADLWKDKPLPMSVNKDHLRESALALAWFHYRGQLKTGANKNKAWYFFLRARIFDPKKDTALSIAQNYQALYEETPSQEYLFSSLEWYRKAYKSKEMNSESYMAKMSELSVLAGVFRNPGDYCRNALSSSG